MVAVVVMVAGVVGGDRWGDGVLGGCSDGGCGRVMVMVVVRGLC